MKNKQSLQTAFFACAITVHLSSIAQPEPDLVELAGQYLGSV
jgi:hypothetical protein